ncbi:MAG: response regulator [Anaerolineae bacterium]|nr:response regulator [Anaerolineae bacterium]
MAEILLVEDEHDLRIALADILTDAGYQVKAVGSGRAALRWLDDSTHIPPDLIISDMLMPGMDGLELLEAVRTYPGYTDTPFVFLSASTALSDENDALKQQGVSYVRKPFDIVELCDHIAGRLESG